jgi:hypothetical protein
VQSQLENQNASKKCYHCEEEVEKALSANQSAEVEYYQKANEDLREALHSANELLLEKQV